MITLRLFFDDGWPDAVPVLDWTLLASDGEPARSGQGAVGDWPDARVHELVLPAGRTLFARAALPASTRQSSGALLGFALEERLLNEPSANLYLAGSIAADGQRELAATEAAGVRRALATLRAMGRAVERVLPEECLLPLPPAGDWSVAATRHGYIVRCGELAAHFVPAGELALPLLTRLLRNDAPHAVRACGAEALELMSEAAALADWQGALSPLPERDWRHAAATQSGDFARGELAPRPGWGVWHAPLRRAARILALTLLLVVAGAGVRTAWLGWQSARLASQAGELARGLVGGAVATDQLARRALLAVDRLRLARGLPARDDALEAMGALAASGGGVRAQTIDYHDGRLTLRVVPPAVSELAAWRERLAQRRYVLQTRPLGADAMEIQIIREP
ncbi:type II secretion system protein GspL [Paludibacterium yongneupense]|uniref:type II secretion system protein GspL n=1 Tax=Paludibacterium yongneupense TaxID=400061 RepID=UPI000412074D|nr:type II secretion system protein GspL [Paludibacterium yongneupense]